MYKILLSFTQAFHSTKSYLIVLFTITLEMLVISPDLFCQTFRLSDINSTNYSIDRIAQQVYFKDFYSDTVRKVDLENLEITKTNFLISPPIFSNKLHLMVYHHSVHNIDTQSSIDFDTSQADSFSWAISEDFLGSFSPNDSTFMYGNPKYYVPMNDTLLKPIPTGLNMYSTIDYYVQDAYPQWSSDTSFVFLSINNSIMAEYFLKSGRVDTLVILANNVQVLGFDYNIKYEILAYSVASDYSIRDDPSQIYFHYKNSDRDTLIFSPLRDQPEDEPCWTSGYRGITSLSWSPDNKKLAFLGFQFINFSAAGIYIYSLDSNRVYKATECNDISKYHMRWANNDTLIYVNAHDGFIYGMDVSDVITSIEQEIENEIIKEFNISSYPNPFNGSTKISVLLPGNVSGTLFIYDAIGKLVKEYHLNEKEKNKYEIIWDGLNSHGRPVSSGFYLGVLKADDPGIKNTRTIKMVYLK